MNYCGWESWQGLKPNPCVELSGTAEAVPCYKALR